MTDATQPSAPIASTPMEGTCLCGAVTLRAVPKHRHLDACHCTMCRNWGGGPFIAVAAGKSLEIVGEEHVTRYPSSDWAERAFCKHCGTHLFYHFRPDGSYGCLAGFFPDAESFTLATEIFVDEQPSYYHFAEKTERKTSAEIIPLLKGEG